MLEQGVPLHRMALISNSWAAGDLPQLPCAGLFPFVWFERN